MSYQPIEEIPPEVRVRSARLEPFISNCYRPALVQLGHAFATGSPAVALVSEGRVGPNLVIESFLESLEDKVTVARILGPCDSAKSCMRQIIEGIGFEPKDMALDDLEMILEMFLVYQKKKKRRTVICIEEAHTKEPWVLEKMQRLTEREAKENFGLMIIRSEKPAGNSDMNDSLLASIGSDGMKSIYLSPFTLAETRDFVRQRVESPDADGFRGITWP